MREIVMEIIAQCAGCTPLQLSASQRLREDLGLDSLDIADLWTSIEERFEVDIQWETMYHIHTVDQVLRTVESAIDQARKK